MKKIDHKNLLKLLKDKGPHDTKLSIDLVKKKLFTDDDDVICDNVMKVSLLCPVSFCLFVCIFSLIFICFSFVFCFSHFNYSLHHYV